MTSTLPVRVPDGKAGGDDEVESEDESSSEEEEPELPGEARATWGNQCELFLSCLGLSMGLGSFWRMPSLVRANGGAAFLVSYVVVSLTVAKPVFFMELFLGQFSSLGSVGVWRCAPIGKGIGVCMCYVSVLISVYFVCFTAHAMLFVWNSLGDRLPWATCDEKWGADAACFVRQPGMVPCKDVTRWLYDHYAHANVTKGREVAYGDMVFYVPEGVYTNMTGGCQYGTDTAAEQFYFHRILGLSEGVDVAGNFRIDTLACIGICWVLLYLSASGNIRFSRKVVCMTSLVSYALLSVLLCRGLVRLPGAELGIRYMLKPEWSKLLNIKVWYEAVQHSLLSGGVSTGVIINLGSFNHFSSGTYTVVAGVALAEVLLGLMSGAVVFSVLGSQSERLGTPIEELARHGLSLFFLSFTEAVAEVDYACVWSAGFFSAFVIIALDSNCLVVESVLTPLGDGFTCVRTRRPRTAFACSLVGFFASMPLAMQNGIYMAFLLDTYVCGMLVPMIAFAEICVVVVFYGVTRLGLDFEFATGRRQCCYINLCLRVFAPCVLGFAMLFSLFGRQRDLYFESYRYPLGAKMMGWCVSAFGLLQIPLFAYAELYQAHFEFGAVCRPKLIWGPDNPELFEGYLAFIGKRGGIKPPMMSPPLTVLTKASPLGSPTISTGKTVVGAAAYQRKPVKAGTVRVALPEDAVSEGDVMKETRPFREAAIRRMSVATGHTPNELKRMEVLRKLRRLNASAGLATETTESEPKERSELPPDAAEREQSLTTAAPLIRLEPVAPPVAPPIGVPPPAPETHEVSATVSPGATHLEGGRAKRKAKGHITISAPTPQPDAEDRPKMSAYARRRSTIHGPPVLGYSDILRRPSIKVTLLEPVSESDPDLEKQAAEQVRRVVKDFRRKSIAVMRKMQSRMSVSGPGADSQPEGGPQPRRSVSGENFLLGRPSISVPPDLSDARRSMSISSSLADPRRSVSLESVSSYEGLPRRPSGVGPSGGLHPELSASRPSVIGPGLPPRRLFFASSRPSVGGPYDHRRASTRSSVSGAASGGSPPGGRSARSSGESGAFSPEELARLRAIARASTSSGQDDE
ncbi:sodium- and chloride-dependent glycine transporter 1-like [Rhipicephalus sanguineus]|uniref:sodium- and chloride-dependent glycine transporter 1-like n=1 Tax=Rhipicephalus sanguineus TaxID=34632 RepID=UPI0020C3B2DE|nr:sodium- and chloride-dependent glycine transporter 1-like [Rhipicephalus sanguineus]